MTLDPSLRDQLIEQARKLAEEHGWTWREPVEVTAAAEGGQAVWKVRTNILARSPSIIIVFRQSDNTLLRSGYLPR